MKKNFTYNIIFCKRNFIYVQKHNNDDVYDDAKPLGRWQLLCESNVLIRFRQ